MNTTAVSDARTVIAPRDFYNEQHQQVFSAMVELDNELQPIDIVTLLAKYRAMHGRDQVDAAYLGDLSAAVPTSANVMHYASIVRDRADLRRIIDLSKITYQRAFEGVSAKDLFADTTLALDRAADLTHSRGIRPLKTVHDEYTDYFTQITSGKKLPGLSTGFPSLDKWLAAGIERDMTIIIGARSSDGKSTFLQNLLVNIGQEHGPGLLFSIEESERRVMRRLHKILAPHNEFQRAWENHDTAARDAILHGALDTLKRLPLFIDANTRYVEDMRTLVKAHMQRHPETTFIAFDYFQLIASRNERLFGRERFDHVLDVIREIKAIAERPVILLSQFRKEEFQPGKGPHLALLKETGRLENDGDVILLLWNKTRDRRELERQQREEAEKKNKNREPQTTPRHTGKDPELPWLELEVIIAKNRDNPTNSVSLQWFPHQFRLQSFHTQHRADADQQKTMDFVSATEPKRELTKDQRARQRAASNVIEWPATKSSNNLAQLDAPNNLASREPGDEENDGPPATETYDDEEPPF